MPCWARLLTYFGNCIPITQKVDSRSLMIQTFVINPQSHWQYCVVQRQQLLSVMNMDIPVSTNRKQSFAPYDTCKCVMT
jgi:hypothetical protein